MTGEMGVVRQMALIKGGLEGLIMGMAEEAMKVSSLSGSLDLFLGKVSVFARNAERKCGRVERTGNCGWNGGCRRKFPRHQVGGEDPCVVRLDGAGT